MDVPYVAVGIVVILFGNIQDGGTIIASRPVEHTHGQIWLTDESGQMRSVLIDRFDGGDDVLVGDVRRSDDGSDLICAGDICGV